MPDFTHLDYLAILWFASCWAGYSLFADHSRWRLESMTSVMNGYRRRWMLSMLRRENRVFDSSLLGNLLNGAAFFASTTIFAVGGLLAALGAADRAVSILAELPIAVATSRTVWELKVLMLVTILIYAFFKFAWTFRLYNYCSVIIGSVSPDVNPGQEAERLAERAARVANLAAQHFNRGVRAYFFALAALSWFIHPAVFIAAASWVLYVAYRRDFRSRSLKAVRDEI